MHTYTTSTSGHCTKASAGAVMANNICFWNRITHKYASAPNADLAGYVRTLDRLQILLSSDQEVLKIGCNPCMTDLPLASGTRSPVNRYVAETMFAIACEKLASQALPQLHFMVANIEVTGSKQSAFDAVLVFNLLHQQQSLLPALETLNEGELVSSKTPSWSEMD